jgi:hypothetical protein
MANCFTQVVGETERKLAEIFATGITSARTRLGRDPNSVACMVGM